MNVQWMYLYLSLCVVEPSGAECGNGIVEGDEECDCKYNETEACRSVDPCCIPGECKLIEDAECRWVWFQLVINIRY